MHIESYYEDQAQPDPWKKGGQKKNYLIKVFILVYNNNKRRVYDFIVLQNNC
jgi:hypothetical protein